MLVIAIRQMSRTKWTFSFSESFLFCLQMKSMVEVLGQPHELLLRAGLYTQYFFSEEKAADGPTWRLMVE